MNNFIALKIQVHDKKQFVAAGNKIFLIFYLIFHKKWDFCPVKPTVVVQRQFAA